MQVLEATVCQLANCEVYKAFEEWQTKRREEQILPSQSLFDFEKKLLKSQALKGERHIPRARAEMFLKALRYTASKYKQADGSRLRLSEAEELQILNLKLLNPAVLENTIDGIASEERMSLDDADALLDDIGGLVCRGLRTNAATPHTCVGRAVSLVVQGPEETERGGVLHRQRRRRGRP